MIGKILKTHLNTFCLLLSFLHCPVAISQSIIEDINTQGVLADSSQRFTETINIISRNGKIFIISNSNQSLSKGDFITISIKDGDPIARALVAKNHDGKTGIKILKVYSLKRWGQLRKSMDVDIVKGDDSFLFKPKTPEKSSDEEVVKIESEEDLFNEKALLEEDLGDFYKDNRLIKPDNIVSAGWDQFAFTSKINDDRIVENQWNFSWSFQFHDNYWVEGLYGRTQIDGFPANGTQTIINNYTLRLKYTFKAPLYSYFLPYIGVQSYQVSSPNAGFAQDDTDEARELAALEVEAINELSFTQPVIGVTFLKRLVPGWFFKADIGSDILSIGFAIEF